MKKREPAKAKPSNSNSLKSSFRRAKRKEKFSGSLKEFIHGLVSDSDLETSVMAGNWLFNKKANFSNPPQEIGNTRRKKTKETSKDKVVKQK